MTVHHDASKPLVPAVNIRQNTPRRAFAEATSANGLACLIDERNHTQKNVDHTPRWIPIGTALNNISQPSPWTTFMVRVDLERFIALDVDDHHQVAREYIDMWIANGIDLFEIPSGVAGHVHVWIRIDSWTRDMVHAFLRQIEDITTPVAGKAAPQRVFDVRRTIRFPFAPHRLGETVGRPDVELEAALRWFCEDLPERYRTNYRRRPTPVADTTSARPRRRTKADDVLDNGFTPGADRSEEWCAVVSSLHRRGRTEDEIRDITSRSPLADWLAKGRRNADKFAASDIRRIVRKCESHWSTPGGGPTLERRPLPAGPDGEPDVDFDEATADAMFWTAATEHIDPSDTLSRHTGQQYAQVLNARRQLTTFSCREASGIIDFSHISNAAGNAQAIHKGIGVLYECLDPTPEEDERWEGPHSRHFRLIDTTSRAATNPVLRARQRLLRAAWSSPTFSWGSGLGASALVVYTDLIVNNETDKLATVATTARRTGLCEGTVRRALRRLDDAQLVVWVRGEGAAAIVNLEPADSYTVDDVADEAVTLISEALSPRGRSLHARRRAKWAADRVSFRRFKLLEERRLRKAAAPPSEAAAA